ncbi:MAG: DNA replication and repair protein RecF, partial [Actinomycetota bacterium]|nr:DNA replication and repair protein RecF [Actinomycetota bacterium]
MRLDRLWLTDFRSYESAELAFAPGLTAVVGDNGRGKSNLLEAVAWLATLTSFRGAPTDALVRAGAARAVLRLEGFAERTAPGEEHDERQTLVEAELVASGRNRVLVNRQRLQRTRDLLGVLRVTVFTPDDLDIVKGGPGGRRRYLDDLLVALHPKYDAVQREVDRVLKQRNALLKQVQGGRRLDEAAVTTLDVFDEKLGQAGEELARVRVALCERLAPVLAASYAAVAVGADVRAATTLRYESDWYGADGGLSGALAAGRDDDVRRGVS